MSLQHRANFLKLSLADFIVRSAYQMGKTPLLPIFAALLGANESSLGLIVSVSTLTGLVTKPLIGFLSDRWGRRLWLLVGTSFFSLIPFAYWLVSSPGELFWLRLIHGMATAIYGPVTLAFIAGQSSQSVAESLGWFGLAKESGYVIGPAVAGLLLLYISPQWVFTVIGLLSCLAFIPILSLSDSSSGNTEQRFSQQFKQARAMLTQSGAIYLAGSLEAINYVVLYALKAFLPLYVLAAGFNSAIVGSFFALQEGCHILLRPFAGRLADKLGYRPMMLLGMVILALSVFALVQLSSLGILGLLAIFSGTAQALIFPASLALVAQQVDRQQLGLSMGLVGALRNAGKVLGPILGGLIIQNIGYQAGFQVLAGGLLLFACYLAVVTIKKRNTPKGITQRSTSL